jgi:hypothetical protein
MSFSARRARSAGARVRSLIVLAAAVKAEEAGRAPLPQKAGEAQVTVCCAPYQWARKRLPYFESLNGNGGRGRGAAPAVQGE